MGFYVSDSEGRYIIGTVPFSETTALPPLTTVSCEGCNGEGYFDGPDLSEMCPCPHCDGTGDIEVCSSCLQMPTVEGGLEVCGCSR